MATPGWQTKELWRVLCGGCSPRLNLTLFRYHPESVFTFGPSLWPYLHSCFAIHPLPLQPAVHSAKEHALLGSVTIGDVCVFPLDRHPRGQRLCLICSVYPGLGHSWLGRGWQCC